VNVEYVWTCFAAAVAIAVPAVCTAWAQSRIGPALGATLAEKPEMSATAVLLLAIPETMVILGFVVAAMIMLKPGG
jgi:V/A-type H+-transporting ATPase subunit K